MTRLRLGNTGLEISAIGLGCWQFSEGGGLAGAYWPALPPATVNEIVARTLAGGINWFDTAESYGGGRSERALSRALRSAGKRPGEVWIATKWKPRGRFASSIRRTFPAREESLAPFPVDLHQVHWPHGFSPVKAEMDAMASLVAEGRVRFVGVSNFGVRRLRRAHAALASHGLPLVSNQVKYSLLDRRVETTGLMAAAKALGVTVIAYSPLEQGLLTGRFHTDAQAVAKLTGPRRWLPAFRPKALARMRPLVDELRSIASAHGATPAQVALAWLVGFHRGAVVAIPGATRPEQAEENAGALSLTLSQRALDRLDQLSRPFL